VWLNSRSSTIESGSVGISLGGGAGSGGVIDGAGENGGRDVADMISTHDLTVFIIGSAPSIAASNSPSKLVASSRPTDRRIGNKFHKSGWVCRYVTLENVSTEMSRTELNQADCICFNLSDSPTLSMIARLHAAAPHLVFLSISVGDGSEQPQNVAATIARSAASRLFDFECMENELDALLPVMAESCIKAKVSLLFPLC